MFTLDKKDTSLWLFSPSWESAAPVRGDTCPLVLTNHLPNRRIRIMRLFRSDSPFACEGWNWTGGNLPQQTFPRHKSAVSVGFLHYMHLRKSATPSAILSEFLRIRAVLGLWNIRGRHRTGVDKSNRKSRGIDAAHVAIQRQLGDLRPLKRNLNYDNVGENARRDTVTRPQQPARDRGWPCRLILSLSSGG